MPDPTTMMLVERTDIVLHGAIACLTVNDPRMTVWANHDQTVTVRSFPIITIPVCIPHHSGNRIAPAIFFAVIAYHYLVREKLPLVSRLKDVIARFALGRPARIVFRRHVSLL